MDKKGMTFQQFKQDASSFNGLVSGPDNKCIKMSEVVSSFTSPTHEIIWNPTIPYLPNRIVIRGEFLIAPKGGFPGGGGIGLGDEEVLSKF